TDPPSCCRDSSLSHPSQLSPINEPKQLRLATGHQPHNCTAVTGVRHCFLRLLILPLKHQLIRLFTALPVDPALHHSQPEQALEPSDTTSPLPLKGGPQHK
ncbi:unnamed protein product, partial [Chrysoparadoxa australica]